jgi:rhodanese-related sulfurtransferase
VEARAELARGSWMGCHLCGHGCGGTTRGETWCTGWVAKNHRQTSAALDLVQHSPGFLRLVDDAKSRVREIDVAGTRRQLEQKKAVLIDVREESEWAAGHARGALHLGKGVIERDIEQRVPDKSAPIILYCGGGFRSALSADNLQKMGYTNVVSMAGGWRAWQAEGAPVEKGS